MQMIIRQQIETRQRRMAQRLDKLHYLEDMSEPMMRGPSPRILSCPAGRWERRMEGSD